MHPFKKAEPSVFCIPRFTHAGDALCVRGERRILRQRVGRTSEAFQRAPVRQRLPVRMARHGKNARFPRNAPGVCFVLMIASVRAAGLCRRPRNGHVRKILKIAGMGFQQPPKRFPVLVQAPPARMVFQRRLVYRLKGQRRLNTLSARHAVSPPGLSGPFTQNIPRCRTVCPAFR